LQLAKKYYTSFLGKEKGRIKKQPFQADFCMVATIYYRLFPPGHRGIHPVVSL